MPYYVYDEQNNRQEAYSKEEILSVLAQAIQDGSLANISKDAGFITKIKCACTGTTIKEAFVTQAQYNELATAGTLEPNTLYTIIDDTTCEDIDFKFFSQNDTNDDLYENIRNINTRLNALGFKEGAFIVSDISTDYITTNSIKKQGKYVIANLEINNSTILASNITIPNEFIPKEDTNVRLYACNKTYGTYETTGIIKTDGSLEVSGVFTDFSIKNAGWEIA